MEFIASRYPDAWLLLARLFEEGGVERPLEKAKDAVRRYLEHTPRAEDQLPAWKKLAELCRRTDDWNGEIHALVELVEVPNTPLEEISNVANRVNGLFATHQFLLGEEKNLLVGRLATVFETHVNEFNATDCSRLAWLYLRLHDEDRARDLVADGLEMEPFNEYCLKLKDRLNQSLRADTRRPWL
jgi:hypothetical protein